MDNVDENLEEAESIGESLATSLKALGLEKDSLEIKRIATVMQDVLVGRADNVSLERAMVATKAEIEKLRGMGREEEAVQLEAMLRAMEEAQAAQVKKKGYIDQWDMRLSRIKAASREEAAIGLLIHLEAELKLNGLEQEAAVLASMREALQNESTLTGDVLEAAALEADDLSRRLKALQKPMMMVEMEELGTKL